MKNFEDWAKENPTKSLNDYYNEVKPQNQSQNVIVIEHHYNTPKENTGVTLSLLCGIVGSILGLIGYMMPFLRIARISQDVNLLGLISFRVGVGSNYTFSLSSYANMIKGNVAHGSTESILTNIISSLPILLILILALSLIKWQIVRISFEMLFVTILGLWVLGLSQMSDSVEIEYQIGGYLLLFSCLLFSIDIFSKIVWALGK